MFSGSKLNTMASGLLLAMLALAVVAPVRVALAASSAPGATNTLLATGEAMRYGYSGRVTVLLLEKSVSSGHYYTFGLYDTDLNDITMASHRLHDGAQTVVVGSPPQPARKEVVVGVSVYDKDPADGGALLYSLYSGAPEHNAGRDVSVSTEKLPYGTQSFGRWANLNTVAGPGPYFVATFEDSTGGSVNVVKVLVAGAFVPLP